MSERNIKFNYRVNSPRARGLLFSAPEAFQEKMSANKVEISEQKKWSGSFLINATGP